MGLAIVLTNKDFSEENLGQVTFALSNEEKANNIAAAYCAAIGDTTYKSDIYNMVLGLLDIGLWTKIYSMYPILGDSVPSLSKNLKDVEHDSIITYANASVGDKKLVFVNTIGVGETSANALEGFSGEFSYYAVFAHVADSNMSTTLQCFKNDTGGVAKIHKAGNSYYQQWGGVNKNLSGQNNKTMRIAVSNVGTGTTCNIVKDGVHFDSATSVNGANIKPNLSLGVNAGETVGTSGETIETNINLFKGDMYFYSIGKLSEAENIVFDGIVKTFLDSVKEGVV